MGIDVWFALEAYEQTVLRRFNVVVLVLSDGNYVPLVRKLNALGSRVMVIGRDFILTTSAGSNMVTYTSPDLMREASYPWMMSYHYRSPLLQSRGATRRPSIRN